MKEEDQLSAAMVLEATKGVLLQGDARTLFTGVSTDSRTLRPGELFVALRGSNFDGHQFFVEAIERGAQGGVVEEGVEPRAGKAITIIKVTDTLQALGDLAHRWRKRHPIPLVAVVGSSGKTTTKEMAAAILGGTYKVMKNPGNLNNLIGLPLSLLKMNSEDRVAIVEMGMNRKGEILRLTQIAEPEVGILTNIGPVHLEGVGSIEGVAEAKGELLEGMGTRGRLIFNADDPRVKALSEGFRGERTSFGVLNQADWMALDIHMRPDGQVSFRLKGDGRTIPISLQLLGRHQVYNALAAAAAISSLGIGMEEMKAGLEAFPSTPMRMELMAFGQGIKIINDVYNANPPSMDAALLALREVAGGRKIAVLGDMWELGAYAEQTHRELGRSVKEFGIDLLFLLGQFSTDVAQGAKEAGMNPQAIYIGKDHPDVSRQLAQTLKQGDWVLVKGSRIMKMEEIIKELRDALLKRS
jgi:UDP-N-acetylmuramoyl-tripeptide--D-alanyl-D-alanine ligase